MTNERTATNAIQREYLPNGHYKKKGKMSNMEFIFGYVFGNLIVSFFRGIFSIFRWIFRKIWHLIKKLIMKE